MPRKLVILDLEGVQVQKNRKLHISACCELLRERGFSVSEDQYTHAFVQNYLPYSIGKYTTDSQFYCRVFKDLGIDFDLSLAKQLHQLYYQSFTRYPQLPGILVKLHQRYPLCLLSNLVNHWVDFIVDKFGLKGVYTYQIISQSAGIRKPDPDIYYKVMELASVQSQNCVYFDDKSENIHAAAKLGIDARLVDPSKGLSLDLVQDLIEK